MFTRCTFVLAISIICLSSLAEAAEWPQFRGPGGAGVSAGTPVPEEWSSNKNVLWKVAIPGFAWSSPVVWGDKVFITTAVSEKQSKPRSGGRGFGGPPGEFPGGADFDEQPPPGGPGGPGGDRQPPRGR